MAEKNYDGISICNFKARGNLYRKIQVFWVNAEGVRQRTVICLGNVRRISPLLEAEVMKACKNFRAEYRKAIRENRDFCEEEADKLKSYVETLKKKKELAHSG